MLLKEWSKKEGRSLVWIAKKTKIPLHRLYNATAYIQPLSDADIEKLKKLTNGDCTDDELRRKHLKPKSDEEKD